METLTINFNMENQGGEKLNKSKSSCCVPNCTVTGYVLHEGQKVTFHKWPLADSKLMKEWYVSCRRDEGRFFKVTKYTKICSRHFTTNDFRITPTGKRYLKSNTVPSRFDWSNKVPNRRNLTKNITNAASVTPGCTDTCISVPIDIAAPMNKSTSQQDLILKLQKEVEKKKEEIDVLQKEKLHLQKLYDDLEKKIIAEKSESKTFSIERFKDNDSDVSFYTGFPNYKLFREAYRFLDVGQDGKNIKWPNEKGQSKRPETAKLTPLDQYFMVLIRLRLGLFIHDLAHRFNVSTTTVNRICTTWINYMYLKLGSVNIWPSKTVIQETMPESCKIKYPDLEWIIDAFEIQCERPSSLLLQSKSYSQYKSRNTVKGLLACTPAGHIGFISELYTGMISDRELTIRCGFLSQSHNKGAVWMVDKGFLIQDLAEPLGVKINMPKFLGQNDQMLKEDVVHTQEIASERIHIERAINKVKNFHIFDRPIQLSLWGSVNQMWTVCALLTLFQNPIISA